MDDQSQPPLFRNADEQERIYAPHQVPGEVRDDLDDGHRQDADQEVVVGSEGSYTPPVVPAQSIPGTAANTPLPPTAVPDLLTNRETRQDDVRD